MLVVLKRKKLIRVISCTELHIRLRLYKTQLDFLLQ